MSLGGASEVARLGQALAQANVRRASVMSDLTAAVLEAADRGVSESELARQAGVDRMTIRRMRGKDR